MDIPISVGKHDTGWVRQESQARDALGEAPKTVSAGMAAEGRYGCSTRECKNTDISIKKAGGEVCVRDRKTTAGFGRTGRGEEVGMGRAAHTEISGSAMELNELFTPTWELPVFVGPHTICQILP